MAEQGVVDKVESDGDELPEAVLRELQGLTDTERAAVIMLCWERVKLLTSFAS